MDQEWRDHFAQTNVPGRHSQEDEEKRQFMFDSLVAGASLPGKLLDQVRMSELTEDQRSVAEMIIGNIDDSGRLQSSVDELAFSTNIPAEKINEVLKVIQSFDPPGVAARDLRECLMIQLQRQDKKETIEYKILDEYFEQLANAVFLRLRAGWESMSKMCRKRRLALPISSRSRGGLTYRTISNMCCRKFLSANLATNGKSRRTTTRCRTCASAIHTKI